MLPKLCHSYNEQNASKELGDVKNFQKLLFRVNFCLSIMNFLEKNMNYNKKINL
jgi:hypothetical protein